MASSLEAAGEPVPTSAVLMSASKHIAVRCRGVLPGIGENISSTSCAKVIMLKHLYLKKYIWCQRIGLLKMHSMMKNSNRSDIEIANGLTSLDLLAN
ncbi:hypothetical protein Hdeb2414_s0016g00476611 [Helianthus debilis subsp. tardiflorus]